MKSFCLHKVSSITPCQSLMYVQYTHNCIFHLQFFSIFAVFFPFIFFLLPFFPFSFFPSLILINMNRELYTSLQLGKPDLDSITSSTLYHIKSGVNYLSKRGSRTNKRDSRTCKRVFRTRSKIQEEY